MSSAKYTNAKKEIAASKEPDPLKPGIEQNSADSPIRWGEDAALHRGTGRMPRFGTVFAGQSVGIEEIHNDIWLVSYDDG